MSTSQLSSVNWLLSVQRDEIVVFLCSFLVVYYYMSHRRQATDARLPPSIKSLPVIGSVPYLPQADSMHKFFLDKLPTMGPVIGFRVLSQHTVVLNTREAIAEAFMKPELSSRPAKLFLKDILNTPMKGVLALSYTAEFKKYHQLTLSILKEFGFGKLGGVMESRIQNEVSDLIRKLKATSSEAIDPNKAVKSNVLGVIADILFGQNDNDVKRLIQHISELSALRTALVPVALVPALRFLSHFKRVKEECLVREKWFADFMENQVERCRGDKSEPSFVRSFIEAEGSEEFDKVQLTETLKDLTEAGFETTSTAVLWAILLLANHQDIQCRLQAEIDGVVPKERLPSLDDRSKLPFVEAFILELMRFKTIAPLGVPHFTDGDTTVAGYHIPAHTIVISNIYAVHMDPIVWKDPTSFYPDRFLDQAGVNYRDYVIPFSVGKRSCLGKLLARQELFLFITGIIQSFCIQPPKGHENVDCKETFDAVSAASAYKVRFVLRE